MVDLVFEDPPEPQPRDPAAYDVRKNSNRDQIVAALAHHPGRWAVVSRHLSRSRASHVARLLRENRPALYEFRAATGPGGEGVVYGRYAAADANIG